jgi:homeobox protein ESX1
LHPKKEAPQSTAAKPAAQPVDDNPVRPREIGGPVGPEPTRYGDWERNGRCIDF